MKNIILALLLGASLFMGACDDGVTVTETCGDNFLDPGEECDGAQFSAPDCAALGFYGQVGDLTCTTNCMIDDSACVGRCGDGEIQDSEEDCDGTTLGGQSCIGLGYYGGFLSCAADCSFDLSSCASEGRCGDGELQEDEECDGTELQGATCADQGYYEGEVACAADCTVDFSGCTGICGDGEIQESEEDCDGLQLNGETCESLGYYEGELACHDMTDESTACNYDESSCEEAGRCGDNRVQEPHGEQCDGAMLNGATCQDVGRYAGAPSCNADCTLDYGACTEYCGDGVINGTESCDEVDFGAETCQTAGYYSGSLTCSDTCDDILSTNCSGQCGDGVVQTSFNEQCDGTNFNGYTCQSAGFGLGQPDCYAGTCQRGTNFCMYAEAIDAGYNHTCVRARPQSGSSRFIYCWGKGTSGQLGLGNTLNQNSPVMIPSRTDVSFIAGGGSHSCIVDGATLCWGEGSDGQLGDDEFADSPSPVGVLNLAGTMSSLSSGQSHTCAVDSFMDIYCWGANGSGQLGRGNTSVKEGAPEPVNTTTQFLTVSAGEDHTCGVAVGGAIHCWGNNLFGQLGTGNNTQYSVPTFAKGGSNLEVSAGKYFTCSRDMTTVSCWGSNSHGQLAAPLSTTSSNTPLTVTGPTAPASITAGGYHACAVLGSGQVSCWGRNDSGQLGNGTVVLSIVPTLIGSLSTISSVSAGEFHTCALRVGGNAIWCWGKNDLRQLGSLVTTGAFSHTPVQVSP